MILCHPLTRAKQTKRALFRGGGGFMHRVTVRTASREVKGNKQSRSWGTGVTAADSLPCFFSCETAAAATVTKSQQPSITLLSSPVIYYCPGLFEYRPRGLVVLLCSACCIALGLCLSKPATTNPVLYKD